jgi:hypothetical protein
MDWQNERYIRFYTRETAETRSWSWQARAIWPWLMARCDRAGVLQVRNHGKRHAILAAFLNMPTDVVAQGIADLIEDGCIVEREDGFLIRNFLDAQEVPISDSQRQRDSREKRRAHVLKNQVVSDIAVTPCHAVSRGVTPGHEVSLLDKTRQAEPSLSKQDETTKKKEEAFELKPTETDSPPVAAKKLSDAEVFWLWAQEQRSKHTGLLREGEAPPDVVKLRAWYRKTIDELGSERRLKAAWAYFILEPIDDHWPKRGFPFNGFMADTVWRRYVQPTTKEEVRERTG